MQAKHITCCLRAYFAGVVHHGSGNCRDRNHKGSLARDFFRFKSIRATVATTHNFSHRTKWRVFLTRSGTTCEEIAIVWAEFRKHNTRAQAYCIWATARTIFPNIQKTGMKYIKKKPMGGWRARCHGMHDTEEWAMTLCIYNLAFPIHLSSSIQWSWSLVDIRSVFLHAFFRVWSRFNRRLDLAVPASDWLLVLEYLQYFQYFQFFGMHFPICAWEIFSGRKRQFVSWDGLWGGASSQRRENLLEPRISFINPHWTGKW